MGFDKVAVLGLGKVGQLAATFLHHAGFQVTGIDQRAPRDDGGFKVHTVDIADPAVLHSELSSNDAVLSCLPYHLNKMVAGVVSSVVPPSSPPQETRATSATIATTACFVHVRILTEFLRPSVRAG